MPPVSVAAAQLLGRWALALASRSCYGGCGRCGIRRCQASLNGLSAVLAASKFGGLSWPSWRIPLSLYLSLKTCVSTQTALTNVGGCNSMSPDRRISAPAHRSCLLGGSAGRRLSNQSWQNGLRGSTPLSAQLGCVCGPVLSLERPRLALPCSTAVVRCTALYCPVPPCKSSIMQLHLLVATRIGVTGKLC